MYDSLEEQNRKYNRAHRHDVKIDPERYPFLWKEQQERDQFDQRDVFEQNQKVKKEIEHAKHQSKTVPKQTISTVNRPGKNSRVGIIILIIVLLMSFGPVILEILRSLFGYAW